MQNWGKLLFVLVAGISAPLERGCSLYPSGRLQQAQAAVLYPVQERLEQVLAGVSWGGCWFLHPVVQHLVGAGWAMPEWHYPALFLHLHGDVQEAVQMEICKTER